MLVSFVFSFKNEENNIEELVTRVNRSISQIKECKYEMIFVNDASTDNSEKVLLNLQKDYPIKIINMSRNFGLVPCQIAGFKHSKGDCIIYMDSDLQDPPEIIPKLIEKFKNGSDVVHTKRTKRLGESKFKLFITKIAYKIINNLSDIDLPIEAGDFKLISRKALNVILKQSEFTPYLRGMSVWVGFEQSYVEYVRESRNLGKSQFPLLSSGPAWMFVTGVTAYSLKPLYIGIFLGFISIIFSGMLIVYALIGKYFGNAVPGSSGIIITISFFSGMILLTLGIIGIYVARIFQEVRGRESYVIKNIKEKN
tara:strand:- start:2755 stop:3684 length:930 start_codon:yes stop_codon:yes gene_type:complete